MNDKKRSKPAEKSHRPIEGNKNNSKPGASGVPGSGGSREGNIGHQSNDQNDNPHR